MTVWQYTKDRERSVVASQLALPVDVEQQGEIRLYTLSFPFLPPSKNVYENWPPQWKHSAKGKWVRAISRKCDELMMPKGVEKVGMAATLVFPNNNRRDPQNYAQALWHWVPDALQVAGIITGDHEGKIEIPGNWGLKFAHDLRRGVPKSQRERTILAVTMLVPEGRP